MKKNKRKAQGKPKPVFDIRPDGKFDTGAPTKYRAVYDEQVRKLCLLGATDKAIAEFFEVDEATINRWKIEFPSFCESIKTGKQHADMEVAESLFKRATGYKHDEDVIFQYKGDPVIVSSTKHYAPDVTAAIFWLKNRTRRNEFPWKDRMELISQAVQNLNELSDEDLQQEIQKYEPKE
jgi:hypothetical protein